LDHYFSFVKSNLHHCSRTYITYPSHGINQWWSWMLHLWSNCEPLSELLQISLLGPLCKSLLVHRIPDIFMEVD